MPFRDRVARRFGETVSAPQFELDSDDSGTVVELAFATPAISFSQPSSPFHNHSPCCSPPASDSLSSLDDDSNVYKQGTAFHSAAAKKRALMHKALGPQYHKTGSKIIKAQAKTMADEPGTRRRLRPRGISSRRSSTPTGSSSSPVPSSSSPLSSSRNSSPAPRRVTRSRARPSSSVSRTSTSPASSEDSLLDEFNELFGGGRSACGRGTRFSSRRVYTDARGNQLSPTSPYLSYHDVCLTFEDIKALRSDWLTDNNIAFWEEWLEREILPKYPQARICLLRPSMAYLLMRDQNPRQLRPVLPDMTKVTHVFLPINDAASRTQPDGSHWSLLLVSKLDGVAFHYDSLGGANNMDGERATTQLSKLLGMPLRYQAINDCPQQENGNDCGVFVCILMRHLLVKRLLNANAREKVSMSMSNKMIDSNGARKEMIKIIESLRKEGERRRSASPFAKSEGAPRID